MRELKYFAAYITPLTVIVSLYFLGLWAFTTIIVGFVLIPIIELLLPRSQANLSDEEEEAEIHRPIFDWLLYLNVPLLYCLLGWYIYTLCNVELQTFELVGITTSIGFALGVMGINVGHELGHRQTRGEQFLAKMLLLHHYKAARKYQILRHLPSPQLPLGYPASMILALLPPLWFAFMHPKIEKYAQNLE